MGDAAKKDEWLPQGWRMEVKVRSNGKKDKFYFPPSGEGRLCSKLEVSRYLNNSQPIHGDKKQGDDSHSSKKVIVEVEKTIPAGLPPGWTKEIKVTKKGHKIRKDAFYTDPVSGYVFRSMKDALRYLESGELGKMAFKPKDKGSDDMELDEEKVCSPVAAKKQKLALNGASSPITSDLSKSSETESDEQIPNSGSSGECPVASEHTYGRFQMESSRSELPEDIASDKGAGKIDSAITLLDVAPVFGALEVQTESSSSELLAEKGSSQTEGKSDFSKSGFPVAPSVGVVEKQSFEVEKIKAETKRPGSSKSKKKKDLDLPRRASKRLAGVPLDPTPELKANRTRRATAKLSDEIVARTPDQSSPDQHGAELDPKLDIDASVSTKMEVESSKGKHAVGIVEHVGKAEREALHSDKRESAFVPLPRELDSQRHDDKVATNQSADEKPSLLLDPSLGELWQDPCIAFAIKTLTGVLDDSDSIKVSPIVNNSEFSDLGSLEDHSRRGDVSNGVDKSQGYTMVFPRGNLAVPEEHSGDVETSDKADERPGSPLNLPFADAWVDPCIEFAIKTLTGAIPLDYNMVIQDFPPQQGSASELQERSSLTLPNVGEFCQTEYLCQQYGSSEKPLFNQAALVEPALPKSKKVNFGYTGGTSRCQSNEERSNKRQR